jgi:hypothetical protein
MMMLRIFVSGILEFHRDHYADGWNKPNENAKRTTQAMFSEGTSENNTKKSKS